jgi:hypothetical protein
MFFSVLVVLGTDVDPLNTQTVLARAGERLAPIGDDLEERERYKVGVPDIRERVAWDEQFAARHGVPRRPVTGDGRSFEGLEELDEEEEEEYRIYLEEEYTPWRRRVMTDVVDRLSDDEVLAILSRGRRQYGRDEQGWFYWETHDPASEFRWWMITDHPGFFTPRPNAEDASWTRERNRGASQSDRTSNVIRVKDIDRAATEEAALERRRRRARYPDPWSGLKVDPRETMWLRVDGGWIDRIGPLLTSTAAWIDEAGEWRGSPERPGGPPSAVWTERWWAAVEALHPATTVAVASCYV